MRINNFSHEINQQEHKETSFFLLLLSPSAGCVNSLLYATEGEAVSTA